MKKKFSSVDVKNCRAAIVAFRKLEQAANVKRYPSIAGLASAAIEKLTRMETRYKELNGYVFFHGMVLPFNRQTINDIRGSASVLYACAYPKNSDTKIEGWRKDIVKVTERALEVLDWLGKK